MEKMTMVPLDYQGIKTTYLRTKLINDWGLILTTPLAALHVDGSILTTQGIYFGSMENSISFGEDGNGMVIIIGPETDLSTAGNPTISGRTTGNDKNKTTVCPRESRDWDSA